jgi:hypothetical protein
VHADQLFGVRMDIPVVWTNVVERLAKVLRRSSLGE